MADLRKLTEQTAIDAIVRCGRARLAPVTYAQLRTAIDERGSRGWEAQATPRWGAVSLIVDPSIPVGWIVPDDMPGLYPDVIRRLIVSVDRFVEFSFDG